MLAGHGGKGFDLQKSGSQHRLAANIGLSPFVTMAALLGQMQLPEAAAAKAAAALDLPEAKAFLTEIPMRGVTWSRGPHRSDNLSIL
jgi:cyanate lyase